MKAKKIYISGAITGVKNYKDIFNKKKKELEKEYPGADIINPAEIALPDICTWDDYMMICMHLLKSVDEIYMLPGWKASCGASAEHLYAVAKGIEIKGALQ